MKTICIYINHKTRILYRFQIQLKALYNGADVSEWIICIMILNPYHFYSNDIKKAFKYLANEIIVKRNIRAYLLLDNIFNSGKCHI